ncbi:lysylphosphatidylglycerol synthase transmembrane domain-containing protein [Chitinophaga sp. Cy-1792]|uniref:lysylphosphatidylglycerol synthase transmembrane domain-containing protein n=1 Tax=Chitinophaga sp. Cy-1792 TaxID=2608339 RepID=UPI001423E5DB|nr:lysylphosphatidylglycerol synthase transmembrane domain-containing protein [Chitinophaga sp. Cy-1792]NIG54069.1 flippase-like domain-containing protein [Chitinophaga sp. Cy-1792]
MADGTDKNDGSINTSYWIWTVIFIVFAVVLVIHFLPEIKKDLLLLKSVKFYWLAFAIMAQLLTYFFAATVYRILIRSYHLKENPSIGALIKATIISLFFNQTVPSGGISGNTFIFRFLKRFDMPVTDIISLIVIELSCYYAALEILIIGSLLGCLLPAGETPHAIKVTLIAGIFIFILLGTLMLLAGRKQFLVKVYDQLRKIKFFRKRLSAEMLETANQETKLLQNKRLPIIKSICFQLLVLLSDCFTVYALLLGLGAETSAFTVLLVFLCTRIIAILPISPGALVLYESSMVFFFSALGVPVGTGIVVTLLYRLLSFWLPMPAGLILYRNEQRKDSQP